LSDCWRRVILRLIFDVVIVRLLEEGDIKGSEEEKKRVEQLQRDNRKVREEQKTSYNPRWFRYALFIWRQKRK
jgi:hypothetical protein